MNMLTLNPHPVQTMSSLELVEFINSQRKESEAILSHADFMKKVPKVLGGGEGKFSDTYVHPQNGQTYPCYVFPKREACLMAMSYSYELQAAVYDRMTALEAQAMQTIALPNFTDPAEAAVAWAAEFKAKQLAEVQVAQLENKVTEMSADVRAFDRIAKADGLFCITDAAKMLGMRPKDLRDYLKASGWIYKRPPNRDWLGYQDKVQQGLVDHKYHDAIRPDGTTKPTARAVITPKGLQKLAKTFAAGGEL